MSAPPAWSISDDGRQLDLHPPGFVGFYRTLLATVVMGVAMVLPLGLLGMFAAAAFGDFGIPLRLLMGVAGSAAVFASVWAPSRLLVVAWAGRTRIRATSEGLLVEQGTVRPKTTVWLAPRDAIEVTQPKADDLGRRGVTLTVGETSVRLAVGHRTRDQQGLLRAVKTVVQAGAGRNAARPAPSDALGPTWRQSLRALWRDLAHPLLHPTPYLLVDVVAIVVAPLIASALLAFDWRTLYPVALLVFCVGLGLRRFDGSYVGGMRHYPRVESMWFGVLYVSAGVVIALFAAVGLVPRFGFGPVVGLAAVAVVTLHVAMLRRAKSPAPSRLPRVADFALAASLAPLSVLHESAMFMFVTDASGRYGPLALAMVPVAALLGYVPVRMHAFVDDPGDRGNRIWFWITIGWLTLQPVLSLGPAIAAEL